MKKKSLSWIFLQMDDVSILASRRKGKALWRVEILDSRMNIVVNSSILLYCCCISANGK